MTSFKLLCCLGCIDFCKNYTCFHARKVRMHISMCIRGVHITVARKKVTSQKIGVELPRVHSLIHKMINKIAGIGLTFLFPEKGTVINISFAVPKFQESHFRPELIIRKYTM